MYRHTACSQQQRQAAYHVILLCNKLLRDKHCQRQVTNKSVLRILTCRLSCKVWSGKVAHVVHRGLDGTIDGYNSLWHGARVSPRVTPGGRKGTPLRNTQCRGHHALRASSQHGRAISGHALHTKGQAQHDEDEMRKVACKKRTCHTSNASSICLIFALSMHSSCCISGAGLWPYHQHCVNT